MSTDTIRQYISRLPAAPGPDRVLHRSAPDRVAGSLGALRVSSVFQPVVDPGGTPFGHQAFFRAAQPDGEPVPPQEVLDGLAGEGAVVRFDRMCRTAHALNRFAATEQWSVLFLGVDHRLLRFVPEEHGTTFQRILAGFGVLASRVAITLPAAAGAAPGLIESVLPSYRLLNFQVAMDVTGWLPEAAARIASLRPDFVRVRWNADAPLWASAAHDAGARLVATHIEQPEDEDAALRSGADLLQGYRFGLPVESVGLAQAANREPREKAIQ